MKDIALLGKARSGKDTTAAILRDEFGYQRLAFADRLKEAALEIDPVINAYDTGATHMERYTEQGVARLAAEVAELGWNHVKDEYPEARAFLQNLGHAMRQVDEDIWIAPVMDAAFELQMDSVPVVVTDVRYSNEAKTLKSYGFALVRIVRPGTGGDEHVSETELDGFPTDYTISNDACLEDLAHAVRELVVG